MFAAAHRELPVRHVVIMATPVDFSRLGFLTAMTTEKRLDIDDYIDETGNIPAEGGHQATTVARRVLHSRGFQGASRGQPLPNLCRTRGSMGLALPCCS